MANKKQQKEQITVEDSLDRTQVFFDENKKVIIGVIVALILLIGGYFAYSYWYQAPREEKAHVALFKGQALFEQGMYEQALNGDSLGYVGFLKIADEFGGTDAANLANAYAGICYAHLNKYEEAVKCIDEFSGGDQFVSAAVLATKANCYAQLKQYDKAASTLMEAAQDANSQALSPIYLIQAGNIYLMQGNADKALSAFNMVKEKYALSFMARDIDKYIEKAELMKK